MRPSPDIGPRSFEAWDTRNACRTFSGMVSPGESIRVPVSPTNMTRQATAVPTKKRSRMSMGSLDLPIWVLSIGAKSGRDNVRLHGLFVASLLSGVDGRPKVLGHLFRTR